MSTFVVVVMHRQGNGFEQMFSGFELAQWREFVLERAKEPFHEAVLPGAGFGAGTERYFEPLAQLLVLVAQVFTSLVRVQDGRHGVPAQGI